MQEIFPSYYHKFKCIADKCKHSCCIGWEIDIDEDTMEIYKSLEGELGERIRNNTEGATPHFVLNNERCPFLNDNGLCDIITELGEDGLCDICYLHPRFQNEYTNGIETGLGLCCEEVARIVLSEKNKTTLERIGKATEEEKCFFAERDEVFSILQNRDISIGERFDTLAEKYGLSFDFDLKNVAEKYITLQRLDEMWTKELEDIKMYDFKGNIFKDKEFELMFEQLAVYFVFRNFKGEKNEIYFVLISCYLVGAMWEKYNKDFEKMTDIARMYSAEVEYCIENTEKIKEDII